MFQWLLMILRGAEVTTGWSTCSCGFSTILTGSTHRPVSPSHAQACPVLFFSSSLLFLYFLGVCSFLSYVEKIMKVFERKLIVCGYWILVFSLFLQVLFCSDLLQRWYCIIHSILSIYRNSTDDISNKMHFVCVWGHVCVFSRVCVCACAMRVYAGIHSILLNC